jgi:transposase
VSSWGISWAEADGIKQRVVVRGPVRASPPAPPVRLCVDEKSAGHGQNYLTIVARVEAGRSATVEHVGAGRRRETFDADWQSLTAEQRRGVEAVGIGLWEPFFNSTVATVPGAAGKIVHDPFHLVSYMNAAVNEVPKAEHRNLLDEGRRTGRRSSSGSRDRNSRPAGRGRTRNYLHGRLTKNTQEGI